MEEGTLSKFIILTDSSCDLPAAMASELEVEVLPLTVYIEGDNYRNYLDGREIGFHDFYQRLQTAKNVKTSAVNQAQFLEVLEPMVAAGNDVLYLGFSSGLSGTYNAGASAIHSARFTPWIRCAPRLARGCWCISAA